MMSTLRKSTVRPCPSVSRPSSSTCKQDVEDVGMRLLDLVEQHDLIGPPAHRFGQRAAFLIADIAGRRADQPGDRMFLHIFRHVDAHHRALVVEQKGGERLGELGLADAGRPEEHEGADRPVGVLQAGARPAHRRRDRLAPPPSGRRRACASSSSILQQLVALAFEHLVDRHAGPARHDLGDVIGGHRLVDEHLVALGLDLGELALEIGNDAIGRARRRGVIAACAAPARDRCGPPRAAP